MSIDFRRRSVTAGIVLLGLGAVGVRVAAQPADPVIKVLARRFTFTPSEIRLRKDVPVVLELTTADVLMGFSAPDLGVRSDIVPGQTARVRVVPTKTGTFDFICDIFCGSGHESMGGTIIVE